MHSRWFNLTVVLLWLTMMTWLIKQKVMPAMLIGEPPSYAEILDAQREHPTVGWTVLWDHHELGWAISKTNRLPHELTEINSLIHFDELPVGEMTPDWLRGILRPLGSMRSRLHMEAISSLVFDPLGRLNRFESKVQFEPNVDAFKIRGTIDGGKLSLTVRAGDFTYDKETRLPNSAMLGDAFSPQSELPGLREGQKWTVEVYSPLLPPNTPMEILEAKVEGKEPIQWEDRLLDAWLVVYRKDPGTRASRSNQTQGRMWVHPNGTVLKQEVRLFNAPLTLVRLSPKATDALAEQVGQNPALGYPAVLPGAKQTEAIRHQ
jgi:hypothetical protein